jgi:hypothetical protein
MDAADILFEPMIDIVVIGSHPDIRAEWNPAAELYGFAGWVVATSPDGSRRKMYVGTRTTHATMANEVLRMIKSFQKRAWAGFLPADFDKWQAMPQKDAR